MKVLSSMVGISILALSATPLLGQAQGFLGIRAQKTESPSQCAVIELLAPRGPGEKAGLAAGDTILSINGVEVDCTRAEKGAPLVPRVRGGDAVHFKVLRGGETLDIEVMAETVPAEVAQAQEERARMEAGRAIFVRLAKTREVFTVQLGKEGLFTVSGQFSDADAELLHFYLQKAGQGAMFPKVMKTDRQEMYLYFDPAKGGYQYEFVAASQPADQAKAKSGSDASR